MGVGGVEQKVLFRIDSFPGFIQGWGLRVDPRYHLLVCDAYQGNEEKDFVTSESERV